MALVHIERAHHGSGSWQTAHAWVTATTRDGVSAADDTGLHFGAPAVAYVLRAAQADGIARYGSALAALDRHVRALVHRRVDAALARIDRGALPDFAEYDLLHGLTGIGAHLLQREPGGEGLGRVLRYLVTLTGPLRVDGTALPGWWVRPRSAATRRLAGVHRRPRQPGHRTRHHGTARAARPGSAPGNRGGRASRGR